MEQKLLLAEKIKNGAITKTHKSGAEMKSKLPTIGRFEEIDILKGIGIILMVWDYCGAPFHN